MSENPGEGFNGTHVAEPVEQQDQAPSAPTQETGTKRPRSNSLEAAAAQALTQLDGPPHHRQQPTGSFQPTLGPPQPMHPSQYANAFSAGQNPGQQQQQQQAQPQVDPSFATAQMSQSPAFRPNTGSPVNQSPAGPATGSPAGGRAPGAHQARQRTAVACRYCRKRKIRCTGISHDPNDPRCSNCRRLDQECIYAPVGAPQGNYTRQPMPDAYGRGHPFHPMPQQMMQGQHQQWQGQPMGYPPQPYMQYAQGRGMPGPDGQHQFPQGGQGYMPAPGYPPQGQHYAYDNSYPNYVNDPNAAQGQGQFGRLKPETFAVYPSPSANQPHPSVIDPAVQQASEVPEPIPEAVQDATEPEQVQAQPQQEPAQQGTVEATELKPTTAEPAPAEASDNAPAEGEVAPPIVEEPAAEIPLGTEAVPEAKAEPSALPSESEGPAVTDDLGGQDSTQPDAGKTIGEDPSQIAAEEGTNLLPSVENTNDLPAEGEEDAQLSKLLNSGEATAGTR
ncbi:C6 zinc finger domain protein [Taphrina deformans PYCC 5710]|uniref:C6 zinc finger domain protein n=1 Tax=Taphrina deformans (strain PYCC 5710 / ATCC 11124 / CBS 356.35 / IMI 108563 / JCM 9778 / NBRC 8474) TaxID=1097556 RepID=R4X7L9_TAPDE|nr:C6 zinc finger domain protein [Taphrina deformans PYCC 5710]|eukprot:CCG81133.1 C6 zinc finger domain protein [Taphrina deformans PYCC 5710]